MLKTVLAVLAISALTNGVQAGDKEPVLTLTDARLILPDDPAVGFNASAGAIDVDVLAGAFENDSVSVRFDDERETMNVSAEVYSKSEERAADATLRLIHDEGTSMMRVQIDWPGRKDGDWVKIEIDMPNTDILDLATANGGISINGGDGIATLRSGNGGLSVKGFGGSVDARTSNGGISMAGALQDAKARTNNGAISISLADGSTGAVDAQTRNGAISLYTHKAFDGKVEIETRNGGIMTASSGGKLMHANNGKMSLVYGESDIVSRLHTRNGGIRVQRSDS